MLGISFDDTLILNGISSKVMSSETQFRFPNRFIVSQFIVTPSALKNSSKRYALPTSEPRQRNHQIKMGSE